MDTTLRNLERQYQADPNNADLMRRLITAYQRSHSSEIACTSELTEDTIREALEGAGIGIFKQARNRQYDTENFWEIEFVWGAEPELAELNHFADILGLNPEYISVCGDYEDTTQCSCGSCPREVEARLKIEIRIPLKEALTSPAEQV